MGLFYQEKDAALLDYAMYQLHGEWFRGPPSSGVDGVVCLGAAQTFGRYCDEPFPLLLGRKLGCTTLNLGSGGKGPRYFLDRPHLLAEINRYRVAVVQVMSARSGNNSVFVSKIGGDWGTSRIDGREVKSLAILEDFLKQGDKRRVRRLIRESQASYLDSMTALLGAVTIPKVLLWISYRRPPSGFAARSIRSLIQTFPQLVDRRMLARLRRHADATVEVSTGTGWPQQLVTVDGTVVGSNRYYPTPEMHREAADALVEPCRRLMGRAQ